MEDTRAATKAWNKELTEVLKKKQSDFLPDGEHSCYSTRKTFLNSRYPPEKHWGPIENFLETNALRNHLEVALVYQRLRKLLGDNMNFRQEGWSNSHSGTGNIRLGSNAFSP